MATKTTDERAQQEPRGVPVAGLISIAVAALAMTALLVFLPTQQYVESLRVDNPHAWLASVEVRGEGDESWMPLGLVPPGGQASFDQVLDMGPAWEFRFSYAGTEGATVVVDRELLVEESWVVTVPDSFAARMEAEDLAPSGDTGAPTPDEEPLDDQQPSPDTTVQGDGSGNGTEVNPTP
jgi:hypothetical protein